MEGSLKVDYVWHKRQKSTFPPDGQALDQDDLKRWASSIRVTTPPLSFRWPAVYLSVSLFARTGARSSRAGPFPFYPSAHPSRVEPAHFATPKAQFLLQPVFFSCRREEFRPLHSLSLFHSRTRTHILLLDQTEAIKKFCNFQLDAPLAAMKSNERSSSRSLEIDD